MTVDHGAWFARHELACRCCGQALMDAQFIELLDALREDFGPIILSSAYRCPDYNAQVSSTGRDGPHTMGKAVDILVSGADAHRLLRLALDDFSGVGVSQKGPHESRFIHLDTIAEGPRPWVWSY